MCLERYDCDEKGPLSYAALAVELNTYILIAIIKGKATLHSALI